MEQENQREDKKISLSGIITSTFYGVGAGIGTGIGKNLFAGNAGNVGGAIGCAGALTILDNYRRKTDASEYVVDTGIAVTTSAITYAVTDFLFNYFTR